MHDDTSGWTEADITINGHTLSFAESMTVRVALSNFGLFVRAPENSEGLGVELARGYDRHIKTTMTKLLDMQKG